MKSSYKLSLAIILAALTTVSCSKYDFFGFVWTISGDADKRFEESLDIHRNAGHQLNQNNELTYPILSLSGTYRVLIGTDTHLTGSTSNLDAFISTFKSEKPLFVLHLGDVIDAKAADYGFDIQKCFAQMWDDIFFTCGNHDIYFNQWSLYKDAIGSSSYSFEVRTLLGNDLYICADSANGTLGSKQIKWLREKLEKAQGRYRHIIVFTHTHLFKKDDSQEHTSNYNTEEIHEILGMMSKYGVSEFLCGHQHYRQSTTIGNVHYQVFDAMKQGHPVPGFAMMTVGDDIRYNFVTLSAPAVK